MMAGEEKLSMSTSVKAGAVGFPLCLGKVYPAAAFATASAALTMNVLPVQNDGTTPDRNFNGIFIQASPTNDDVLYVCTTAAAPDTALYTNVLAVLQPGAWYPRGKEWANNRDVSKLFVGANNATDFAIVSLDQF